MRLIIGGLDSAVEIEPGCATVLQVVNQTLFTRIARSFQSGNGVDAIEPYSLWDGDEEVPFKKRFLFVSDPLNLPWDDKQLMPSVVKRIEREFLEDEDLRRKVECAERELTSSLFELSLGLDSTYGFEIEWDFKRYLKMLGFHATVQEHGSYLDNLMDFIALVLDSGCNQGLLFVNLKTFLTKNDLEKLYQHIFYSEIPVLMLENKVDETVHEHENKRVIDQDFLEF